MKNAILLMCVVATGSCLAQEENHLKGSNSNEFIKTNAIEIVQERRLQMDVSMYPNPSDGNVFIETKENSTITIYSISGTYVGTWKMETNSRIEITELPIGSYLCVISNENVSVTKKLMVI